MSALDRVRERLPEAARDIKINLQTVLGDSSLTAPQKWGVALASAHAARNVELREALLEAATAAEGPSASC